MGQWHCTVGDRRYGPVESEVLRQWVAEGRIKASDLVWTEGMASWQPAGLVPELGAQAAPFSPGAPTPPPFPAQTYPFSTRFAKPHRANLVLVFGILGLVVCVIFGIVAWVMGNNDLQEMDAGIMDPSGRDTTKIGRILGMIGSILGMVGAGIVLLAMLAGVLAHR
jgi:hypothetical protein